MNIEDETHRRIERASAIHRTLVDASGPESAPTLHLAADVVELPSPTILPNVPLVTALQERRSRYDFHRTSLHALSTLLRWSLGPSRTVDSPAAASTPPEAITLRLHPTAGGLPSLGIHLILPAALDEAGPGVYEFDPVGHRLTRTRVGPVAHAVESALVQPQFARRAPAIIVLVGRLDVALAKYTERHYRTLHVDAGIAAQNLYLVGTALNLTCCAISGFYDDALARTLGLVPNSIPLLAFAVGGRGELGEQR